MMVGVLILLPWYLNKFHLEVVYPTLHLLKVLIHPFVLAIIIAINLTGYYLGIAARPYLQLLPLLQDLTPLSKLRTLPHYWP